MRWKKLEVLPFALQGPGGIPITFYSHILRFLSFVCFFWLEDVFEDIFFNRFVHQVQKVKNVKNVKTKPRKKSWKNIRCFIQLPRICWRISSRVDGWLRNQGVWDRIVEFLRYEGKVTSREIGDLSWPWLQKLRKFQKITIFKEIKYQKCHSIYITLLYIYIYIVVFFFKSGLGGVKNQNCTNM